MAAIIKRMMCDGYRDGGFDSSHSTALVNMSHLFWDPIHSDERLAFNENNSFVKFFYQFAQLAICSDNFYKDEMENIQFKEQNLKAAIMCLFEGLTKKLSAFNYVRFVFQVPFSWFNLFSVE